MQVLAAELDRLAVGVDLVCLGDGMEGSQLQSPHEAKVSRELMGELAAKGKVGNDAADDGPGLDEDLGDRGLRRSSLRYRVRKRLTNECGDCDGLPIPLDDHPLVQLVGNLDKVTPALDETRQDGLEGGVRVWCTPMWDKNY